MQRYAPLSRSIASAAVLLNLLLVVMDILTVLR